MKQVLLSLMESLETTDDNRVPVLMWGLGEEMNREHPFSLEPLHPDNC